MESRPVLIEARVIAVGERLVGDSIVCARAANQAVARLDQPTKIEMDVEFVWRIRECARVKRDGAGVIEARFCRARLSNETGRVGIGSEKQ